MGKLPGGKEGISSSVRAGLIASISNSIEEEKLEEALTVLTYFSSKDVQKKYIMNNGLISAIPSLYEDDEEVCEVTECEIFRNTQSLNDPLIDYQSKKIFYSFFRKYLYDFLAGRLTALEASQKITDISKIYYISLDTTDSYIGLIITIMIIVVSTLMLLSLIFLFRENFNPFFTILPVDFWILSVMGTILFLCSSFTHFGRLTEWKCFLNLLVQLWGMTLFLIPILYELILQYPTPNNLTEWIIDHRHLFISFFIVVDVVVISLFVVEPLIIEEIVIEEGKNFEICQPSTLLCKIIVVFLCLYIYSIFIVIMIYLIVVEWKRKGIQYNIKFMVYGLYLDVLSIIIVSVFNSVIIRNYKFYNIVLIGIFFSISLSNYLFIYGIKLILAFAEKKNVRLQFISEINKEFIEYSESKAKTNSIHFPNFNNNNTKSIMKTNFISNVTEDGTNNDNNNNSSSNNNKNKNNSSNDNNSFSEVGNDISVYTANKIDSPPTRNIQRRFSLVI
ncbi:hypothetical protein PIROE2DRAFT_64723 [Piromyces sp. E2]|nr:hypothetical protein PIROE2DRAFT_64723 [Piromyces sp. E2]|eukprot:OUM57925.1 hypothetical protein PIROE2DRAFT_64723 [Piromyces sp. E2]